MDPALDTLIDRYRATVTMPERIQVLGEIIHHVADQVVVAGIYYVPAVGAVANRVANVSPGGRFIARNSHERELRG